MIHVGFFDMYDTAQGWLTNKGESCRARIIFEQSCSSSDYFLYFYTLPEVRRRNVLLSEEIKVNEPGCPNSLV